VRERRVYSGILTIKKLGQEADEELSSKPEAAR
jgi:hypothetical protein